MAHQIMVTKQSLPEGWGIEAADFINRVIKILKYLAFTKKA